MKKLASAFLVVGLLAGCGQATFVGAQRPSAALAARAERDAEAIAKRLLEEQLNAEGPEAGEVDEIKLMETERKGVYQFTLVKSFKDEYEQTWQETWAGTVDVKRKQVKAKRIKREEV